MHSSHPLRKAVAQTLGSGSVALCLAMGCSSLVHAQSADGELQDQTSQSSTSAITDGALAEVQVTGSRIRGVNPVGSPVIAIDHEAILKSTGSNVVDVLKQVPQVFTTGITDAAYQTTSGSGGSNLTRGAAINLRGLNPSATLTLIDGQRITVSGVSAAFVDPTIVPTFALERIEVVPDGASAIYGSDAIAGVVNIITRKSVDGLELNYRYSFADGYDKHQGGFITGLNWDTGHAMLTTEATYNGTLETSERDYLRQDQTAFGGADYRARTCNPGNIVIDGVSYAIPAGGATSPEDLVAGTSNLCDIGYANIFPRTKRINVMAYAEQEVGDYVTLSLQGFYNRREFLSRFGQQGSTLTSYVTTTVPSTNAFFVRPAGADPDAPVTTQFSYFPLRGPVTAEGDLDIYGFFGGAEIDLPGGWRAEISATHTESDEIIYSRAINTAAQAAALASSDPNTALDVFGNRTNPAVIENIFTGLFWPESHSKLSTAAVRLDGSLFDIPGGTVRMATGVEYQNADLVFATTRGTVDAPAYSERVSDRDVKSVYAELFVPLVGAGNAVTGVQSLELSLAGRYDRYSDFGSTENPKFGLTWKPVDDVSIQATYGTSFRAPGLEQLISNTVGLQIINAVDPLSPTGRTVGLAIRDASRDLGPEEATTYSFGVTLTPSSLPDLFVTANYFDVDYSGQIFGIEAADSLVNEDIYSDLIIRNPTPAQLNEVLNMGLPLLGTLPPEIGFIVDSRPYNRGRTRASGLDFQVGYSWHTESAGTFGFDVNGLYFLEYEYQVTPLAEPVDRLNTIYNPLEFRGRAGFNWSKDALNANVWLNYTNSYLAPTVTPAHRVDSWTTVDLHIGYEPLSAGGVLDGMVFSLDASNLLDSDPPYVNIATAYDPQYANALGRLVTLGVRKRF